MKNPLLIKSILLLSVIVLLPATLSDCKKDEGNNNTLEDFYVFDVQAETEWNYWAVAKDGSSFAVEVVNSKPSIVYFKPTQNNDGYPIFLDENGVPSKAVIENHIFLFGNFRKNLMDIAAVLPDGNIKIFRDIPVEFDFTTLSYKGLQGQLAESLIWSGHIISAVSCGVGIATAVPTVGLTLITAAIGCGATAGSILATAKPNSFEVLGLSSEFVGAAATTLGCAANYGISCILDVVGTMTGNLGKWVKLIEDRYEVINTAYYDLNGTVIDVDGNKYNTVFIGSQAWFSENLITTKYYDGTSIPLVTEDTAWSTMTTPAYCWYDNNEELHKYALGALYNWYVVNTGKLCPYGWHVPTDAEWTTLTTYVTNESGFTPILGGGRFDDGAFYAIGTYGYWWTSSQVSTTDAWYCVVGNDVSNINRLSTVKAEGFSVRCIKDN